MISVVWIAKNEEKKLGRSIDSVKAVADEMVVVDTGSTDHTVEVAEEHGARVEHFPWINDFAAARNYGFCKSSGDVVIILDCDEWFDPPLDHNFTRFVNDVFLPDDNFACKVMVKNIDPDYGLDMGGSFAPRVVKRAAFPEEGCYRGAIHEVLCPIDKDAKAVQVENLTLLHDGYGGDASKRKWERNAEILLRDFAEMDETEPRKVLAAVYLSRELAALQPEEARRYMQWALDHASQLEQVMMLYKDIAPMAVFHGMSLLGTGRKNSSRRQVKRVLPPIQRKVHPKSSATKLLDAIYEARFSGGSQEELLRVLPLLQRGLNEAEKNEEFINFFETNAYLLCVVAARRFYRLGEREKLFELAAQAVSYQVTVADYTLPALLLWSVKGLPLQDIILFLNTRMNVGLRGVAENLIDSTQHEGWQQLYLYYSVKLVEDGNSKRTDYYYFLIVSGKYAEAAEALHVAPEGMDEADAESLLFLALVCAQDEALQGEYESYTGAYRPVLQALAKGTGLNEADYALIVQNYHRIAFAAGLPLANRVLELFPNARENFMIRFAYYYYSGLCAELLDEYALQPDLDDLELHSKLADACCVAGRYEAAWAYLKEGFAYGMPNAEWYELAEVVSLKAEGEAKAEAESYRRRYRPLFEEQIDLGDMVRTEREIPETNKKKSKKLADLTAKNLEKWMEPVVEPPFVWQLAVDQQAAALLAERGNLPEAVRLYSRVLGYPAQVCPAGPASALAAILEQVGNTQPKAFLEGICQREEDALDARFAELMEMLEAEDAPALLERQKRALAALPLPQMKMLERAAQRFPYLGALDWKGSEFALLENRAALLRQGREESHWLYGRLAGAVDRQVLVALVDNWLTLDPAPLCRAHETQQQCYVGADVEKNLRLRLEDMEKLTEEQRRELREKKPVLTLPLLEEPGALWRAPRLLEEICPGYALHLVYLQDAWVPGNVVLLAVHPEGGGAEVLHLGGAAESEAGPEQAQG